MFLRNTTPAEPQQPAVPAVERITSVLGSGVIWHGSINGSGGVRIEGAFEGEIALRGMLVIGETGRVTCQNVRANTVIVAGAVRGNITTQKLEIRGSGRVWGDVCTTACVEEEGAFLRGQIRMEETVGLNLTSQERPLFCHEGSRDHISPNATGAADFQFLRGDITAHGTRSEEHTSELQS